MLFEQEHFGKRISVQLSDILLAHTSEKDVAAAAENAGISHSIVDKVKRRKNSLTKDNSEAITELCRIAFRNATQKKEDASKAVRDLRPLIEKIPA